MFTKEAKRILYPFVATMLIYGFAFAIIKSMLPFLGDVSIMEPWLSNILAGIGAAFVGGVITLIVNYKNQINKNTDAVNELKRRLGVDDSETLNNRLSRQYDEIRSDIGLESNRVGSLTNQHNDITKALEKSFADIKHRYEKEDDEYRKFTSEQRDINQTMNNFITDYKKIIGDASNLRDELSKQKNIIEELNERLSEKDKEVARLQEKVKALEKDIELSNKETKTDFDKSAGRDFDETPQINIEPER